MCNYKNNKFYKMIISKTMKLHLVLLFSVGPLNPNKIATFKPLIESIRTSDKSN